jgi:hypothetical protein
MLSTTQAPSRDSSGKPTGILATFFVGRACDSKAKPTKKRAKRPRTCNEWREIAPENKYIKLAKKPLFD